MALTTPSFANVLVRTNPSLSEIQAGIDACNRGDEDNCKYEHYPGVVRKTASGGRILPAGGDYILGKRLTPGSVLPKLSDRRALLRKLKSKEVEVHSFLTHESPILLASSDAGEFLQDHFQRHAVIVPAHIAELARQNGVAPHEMLLHIETRWDGNPREAQEIINEHTALVLAIAGNLVVVDQEQIDEKLEQLEELQNLYDASTIENEALASLIADLQDTIDNLSSELALELITSELLRQKIADVVNLNVEEINEYLYEDGPIPVDNALWDRATARAADIVNEEFEVPHKIIDVSDIADRASISGLTRAILTSDDQIGAFHDWFARTYPAEEIHFSNEFYKGAFLTIGQVIIDLAQQHLADGLLAVTYDLGYEDGYRDGYRDGYAHGYVDGVNSVRDTLNGEENEQ